MSLSDDGLVELLHEAALAVRAALDGIDDWGLAGSGGAHVGQHHSDLAADAAALGVLEQADVGILSEESGLSGAEREIVVVVDPLDGSTNAHRGVPWFATSLCAVDRDGLRAALVVDLVHGRTYTARRGGGAAVDGQPIGPTTCTDVRDAFVGISGLPGGTLGWRQFRSLGAAALDLCAVAEGVLDAYVDCSPSAHGPWDYLGGALVCIEAGAIIGDAEGRELLTLDHLARRTPLAAATQPLFDTLAAGRRAWGAK
ncbi:MAG TPA: inositol monophosphatase [Acidimicrobiales bacterium]|jgi:fructose-1,6-bisphosphatase/inositol monophosphatase family enzyme|nr:inositol monophosphatase [Acidimicrobiales bacterium]